MRVVSPRPDLPPCLHPTPALSPLCPRGTYLLLHPAQLHPRPGTVRPRLLLDGATGRAARCGRQPLAITVRAQVPALRPAGLRRRHVRARAGLGVPGLHPPHLGAQLPAAGDRQLLPPRGRGPGPQDREADPVQGPGHHGAREAGDHRERREGEEPRAEPLREVPGAARPQQLPGEAVPGAARAHPAAQRRAPVLPVHLLRHPEAERVHVRAGRLPGRAGGRRGRGAGRARQLQAAGGAAAAHHRGRGHRAALLHEPHRARQPHPPLHLPQEQLHLRQAAQGGHQDAPPVAPLAVLRHQHPGHVLRREPRPHQVAQPAGLHHQRERPHVRPRGAAAAGGAGAVQPRRHAHRAPRGRADPRPRRRAPRARRAAGGEAAAPEDEVDPRRQPAAAALQGAAGHHARGEQQGRQAQARAQEDGGRRARRPAAGGGRPPAAQGRGRGRRRQEARAPLLAGRAPLPPGRQEAQGRGRARRRAARLPQPGGGLPLPGGGARPRPGRGGPRRRPAPRRAGPSRASLRGPLPRVLAPRGPRRGAPVSSRPGQGGRPGPPEPQRHAPSAPHQHVVRGAGGRRGSPRGPRGRRPHRHPPAPADPHRHFRRAQDRREYPGVLGPAAARGSPPRPPHPSARGVGGSAPALRLPPPDGVLLALAGGGEARSPLPPLPQASPAVGTAGRKVYFFSRFCCGLGLFSEKGGAGWAQDKPAPPSAAAAQGRTGWEPRGSRVQGAAPPPCRDPSLRCGGPGRLSRQRSPCTFFL
ncbi:pannexin-2 isoform X1 [Choloepus didactylus]|uniref:pannexin-2 isoform X1 n=1 Tax=Choloepus didactylus TaxID=27675 RepID=UPI0018A03B3F|nr:pannexin-2 isoform X1 [Choloepus didactylus]